MRHPTLAPKRIQLRDGNWCVIRPIEPDDWSALQSLHARLSPRTRRLRFFSDLRQLPEAMARRFAAIDPEREAAFVALDSWEGEIRAVARYARLEQDLHAAEIAIVVEDAYQGIGLARRLLLHLADHAQVARIHRFVGSILGENEAMLGLLRTLGFPLVERPGSDAIEFELHLRPRRIHSPASCKARWMSGRTA